MTKTSEGNRHAQIMISSLIWSLAAITAAIGLATSTTGIIDYGGQRFGLIPWPGASNFNTMLCLVGSAILLIASATKGVMKFHSRMGR